MGQMRKMGGIASLIDKLPAQLAQAAQSSQMDDRQIRRLEGIINSMTRQERARPEIIKASRKRRIAAGAGVPVQEVNRLLAQFEQTQKMMKMMKGGNLARMMRGHEGIHAGHALTPPQTRRRNRRRVRKPAIYLFFLANQRQNRVESRPFRRSWIPHGSHSFSTRRGQRSGLSTTSSSPIRASPTAGGSSSASVSTIRRRRRAAKPCVSRPTGSVSGRARARSSRRLWRGCSRVYSAPAAAAK